MGSYAGTEGTNGKVDMGREFTSRPTRLKGYFKYSPRPIDNVSKEFDASQWKGKPDTCHICIALCDWDAPYQVRTKPSERAVFNSKVPGIIAFGEMVFSGTVSEWTELNVETRIPHHERKTPIFGLALHGKQMGRLFHRRHRLALADRRILVRIRLNSFFLQMKRLLYISLVFVILTGCSADNAADAPAGGKQSVYLTADMGSSRTAIADDMLGTLWSAGDKISLWAQKCRRTEHPVGGTFRLHRFGKTPLRALSSQRLRPCPQVHIHTMPRTPNRRAAAETGYLSK
ncbi:MAG: PCMD domain-containing protein [Alistipes putredinis]|nr:MAG: PCMD domain-containing protein [Alistipes putredinis]